MLFRSANKISDTAEKSRAGVVSVNSSIMYDNLDDSYMGCDRKNFLVSILH